MNKNQYAVYDPPDASIPQIAACPSQMDELIHCIKKIHRDLKEMNYLQRLELYIRFMESTQSQPSILGCNYKDIQAMTRQLNLPMQKRKKSKSWLF